MNALHKVLLIVAIAGLAGSCGWAYWEYTNQHTETVTTVDYGYTYTATYEVEATVTEENPIYEMGTVLSDMAGYFYAVSPQSTIDLTFTFDPSLSDASVDISTESYLMLKEQNDDGIAFWSKRIPLSSSSGSVTGEGSLTDSFVLEADTIRARVMEIRDSLGASVGRGEGEVVTHLTYEGEIASTTISDDTYVSLPVTLGPDYYAFDMSEASQSEAQNYYTAQQRQVQNTLSDIYIPLAACVAFALAAILIAWHGRRSREGVVDMGKYSEWISSGIYPGDKWEKMVYVSHLADLVDVAIDTNKRVIYDAAEKMFFVIDDPILYYHSAMEE